MPVFNNALAGAAGSGGADAYEIERSLRFNHDDQSKLSRNVTTAGNRRKWTWSGWAKRSSFGIEGALFSTYDGSHPSCAFFFQNNNKFRFQDYSSSNTFHLQFDSNRVFLDPSAWYHFVVAIDTQQNTTSDRVKIYVNGVLLTSGDYSTATYPGYNHQVDWNNATTHDIGRHSAYFDGYIAEVHFVDGQQLAATDFGKFDATTGVWNPIEYTGTYGTNGFYLNFSDNSSNAALGTDSSGNNNTWTVNNMTASAGQAVTVANATGALPILNTSGDQGGTATSGNRTDSNASYLELALPLYGSNNATTFYDNSGNNRTVNNTGTQVKTLHSRFYGSSAYFDGNDHLNIANTNGCFDFGTGDFTVEIWARPSTANGDQYILSWECPGPNAGHAGFNIYNGSWRLGGFNGHLYNGNVGLAAGEWVHLAWSKSSGTHRIFINGAIVSQFGASSLNLSATTDLTLGKYAGGASLRFNGYMNDLRVYKGVAKYTSAFSPPALADNIAAAGTDSVRDSPTNGDSSNDTGAGGEVSGNYAVLQSNFGAVNGAVLNPSNGALTVTSPSSDSNFCPVSIPVSSGKWYAEVTAEGSGTASTCGVWKADIDHTTAYYANPNYRYWQSDGNIYNGSGGTSANYGTTWAAGDVVGIALDMDNGKVFFSKNGTFLGSSNPVTGANPAASGLTDSWVFALQSGSGTNHTLHINTGQRSYSHSAPTGYKALCTTNLPDFVVGTTVFDAVTYDGNGSTKVISDYRFSPDLAWFKRRDTTGYHTLVDTLRTRAKGSYINTTTNQAGPAEFTSDANKDVVSFDSNGFTLGPNNQTGVNENTAELVAWAWDAGDAVSATSVSAGSLSSSLYTYGTYSSKWNDTSSPGSTGTVNSGANAFNGDLGNYASMNTSNTFSKWKPNTPVQVNSSLRVLASGINSGNNQVAVNGTYFYVTNKPLWYTISADYLIEIRLQDTGSTHGRLWAVEVDGKILVDNSITPPSLPSIATSYRANDEAGFSIISYQGNGNTATVATGLSGEPGMILIKDRDTSTDWPVYHKGFDDPQANVNILNNLSTVQSISGYWTGTRSNIIGLKSGSWAHNTSGKNYIAYCWAQREGFSQFSDYRGNGQSDGPFINTGFKPRWILVKHTGGQDWVLFDTTRDPNNDGSIQKITANEINGEVMHNNWIDIFSNGFKLKSSSAALNENGTKYIYSAFAEHPLKLARAR